MYSHMLGICGTFKDVLGVSSAYFEADSSKLVPRQLLKYQRRRGKL